MTLNCRKISKTVVYLYILFLGCPTPPNRRRFFSSRGLKGSVWSFKGLTQSSNNNSTLSGVVLFKKIFDRYLILYM